MHERAARWVTAATQALGSMAAIVAAFVSVIIWAATGPLAHYSNSWQLVINTGSTIVTYLMVFVLQASQNRDGRAIQVKLDAVLAALSGADNALVGIEDRPEVEIRARQDALRSDVTDCES